MQLHTNMDMVDVHRLGRKNGVKRRRRRGDLVERVYRGSVCQILTRLACREIPGALAKVSQDVVVAYEEGFAYFSEGSGIVNVELQIVVLERELCRNMRRDPHETAEAFNIIKKSSNRMRSPRGY